MSRLGRFLAMSAAGALLTTALAAPVAALPTPGTDVAFINGIPGKTIDVCINGWEAKSRLGYGQKYARDFGYAGKTKKVQFRVAAPGRCKGRLLAAKRVMFEFGGDISIVATKWKPRVVVFDNSDLPVLPAVTPPIFGVVRQAANVGAVWLHQREMSPGTEYPLEPAASVAKQFRKGHEAPLTVSAGNWLQLRATQLQATGTIKRAINKRVMVKPVYGKRFEVYLVGTNQKNARFVVLQRTIAFP